MVWAAVQCNHIIYSKYHMELYGLDKFWDNLIGFLLAAAIGGFVLLKAYSEYKKGGETKSKIHSHNFGEIKSNFFICNIP